MTAMQIDANSNPSTSTFGALRSPCGGGGDGTRPLANMHFIPQPDDSKPAGEVRDLATGLRPHFCYDVGSDRCMLCSHA